ncbi:MAG: hypothetical protein OT477_21715 [Chloroflexi bacterium]|nr:hypothetical protein [Chloroflexota bacterium]
MTPTPPDPPQMFHNPHRRGGNGGGWHGRHIHRVFVRATAVPPTPTTNVA